MNRKTILSLIIFLLVLSYGIQAQSVINTCHYEFTYDEAGNRTKRHFIDVSSKAIKNDSIKRDSSEMYGNLTTQNFNEPLFTEQHGEQKLSVYPNPTDGIFNIAISPLPSDAEPVYELVNNNGITIAKKQIITDEIQSVSLTEQPSGIYYLHVKLNKDKNTIIKVIKN